MYINIFIFISPWKPQPSFLSHFIMVDLFIDRVLVKNNNDQDELDTEREIVMRLQNRILMLFFGSAACESCQHFAPTLTTFFKQLTDESCVDRSAQLVLLYIGYNAHTHTHKNTTLKLQSTVVALHKFKPFFVQVLCAHVQCICVTWYILYITV